MTVTGTKRPYECMAFVSGRRTGDTAVTAAFDGGDSGSVGEVGGEKAAGVGVGVRVSHIGGDIFGNLFALNSRLKRYVPGIELLDV